MDSVQGAAKIASQQGMPVKANPPKPKGVQKPN